MSGPPNFIRYVPAQEGAEAKIIRMVEAQRDPLEPPRHKLNQKVFQAPPSPPAPVMHSPPRKITAEEQKQWKIPPCVSSWKNPRGYTVPLDKRCAFNGFNGSKPETINPKFAQLSETLYISNRLHRENLEEKAKAEKLIAQKDKEREEERLRMMAQQAREERAKVRLGLAPGDESEDDEVNSEDLKERRRIFDERHRDRVRNQNIKASAPERRTKFDRHRERDISEKIALGMARPNTEEKDVHDQRLYNQSEGLSSGFADDDEYDVYDKAWKSKESFAKTYRPTNLAKEETEAAAEETSTKAKATDNMGDELAPIQFEKDEDVFNLESFLRSAKYNARKAQQEPNSSKRHRR